MVVGPFVRRDSYPPCTPAGSIGAAHDDVEQCEEKETEGEDEFYMHGLTLQFTNVDLEDEFCKYHTETSISSGCATPYIATAMGLQV